MIDLDRVYDEAFLEAYSKDKERGATYKWVAPLATIPAAGIGSKLAANLYANTPAMKSMRDRFIKAHEKPEWSEKPTPRMQEVIDQFKLNYGVDVPIHPEHARIGPVVAGPAFSPYTSEFSKRLGLKYGISTPVDDVNIMAHELGHAVDSKRMGKFFKASLLSRPLINLGSLAAGSAMMGSKEYNQYAPGIIGGGVGASLLVPEITANLNALKPMYKIGGMRQVARYGRAVLPPFGSYAAVPVGMYLGAKAVQKLAWPEKNKKK